MFCNLSRPVSTWICRIVLELYAVSLLAPGCSFTTDESRHRPRCGQSRTARWFLPSPTSPAAFWEASNARLNVTKCYVSLPTATLFYDKLREAKTSVCDVVSSRGSEAWCFSQVIASPCASAQIQKREPSGRCIFKISFLQGTGQYPKLWTSFIDIIFRHVIIIMEALFKPGHNLLLYGCSEGENRVEKKRVRGESIIPGDFKSLA